tara:strand:+ start:14 stop:316 length:303 start_codon:yes stop_codon:yes gene_type:complete
MFPVGQTIDIVEIKKYIKYYSNFSNKNDFEHVTSYFFENKEKFKIKNMINEKGTYRSISLGLDCLDDYNNAINFIKNYKNYSTKTKYLEIYNYYINSQKA